VEQSGSSLGSIRGISLSTKLKGDITEQAVILHALKRGWGVLKPIGDRLSYDLVFDVYGALVKVQVKTAWFDESRGNYVVDNRRTKTNRRVMVRKVYTPSDFDFALAYFRTETSSMCSLSRCSSATPVRFIWSKLTSVNESHGRPPSVTRGS
jgi:hypothetical protein